MSLAEIREDEAPPDVSAIYARLRAGYGLPLVNLVWRHFATLPGVLPWAWASVAPALPLLGPARVRVAAALGPLPALDLGAPATALARLYNRGNLSNLITLTALLRGKHGHALAPEGAPPTMLPAPPPLPRLDALPDATRRDVLALAELHGHGVVPTLYLHLAGTPEVLAPLHAALAPLMASGQIAVLRDAALTAASIEAEALRPHLASPPEPPAAALAVARGILTTFTGRVIAEMVPIGLMLAPEPA